MNITCIQLDLPAVTNKRAYVILYFISYMRSFLQLICQRDILITEILCIKVSLPNELLTTLVFRVYLPEASFQVFLLIESMSRNNHQNHSYNINATSLKTVPKTIFTSWLRKNASEKPIILQR